MQATLLASTDVVAVGVSVVSTLVVVSLLASALYLLRAARGLRRQAVALAEESDRLLCELDRAVGQAGAEIERVDRMVGSAEALSEAVGSASRLVGGVVAEPLIKLVALGSGIARGARVARGGPEAQEARRARAISSRTAVGRGGSPAGRRTARRRGER